MTHAKIKTFRGISAWLAAVLGVLSACSADLCAAHRDLMALVPKEAIVVVEKRAMTDVAAAFAKSNLGAMAADEVIAKFFNDSRAKIEEMIARKLANTNDEKEAAEVAKLLHAVLKPVWHKSGVFFLMPDKKDFKQEPGMSFIWIAGDMGADAHKAIETMMAKAQAESNKDEDEDEDEKLSTFTYRKGLCSWTGLIDEKKLPEDPKKRIEHIRKSKRDTFMVCRMDMLLCVATNFETAEAISNMLAPTRDTKRKSDNKNLARVLQKTAQKDWVYRWYVDVEAIMKATDKDPSEHVPGIFEAMQLDKVIGVGGSGGFADGVFSDKIYVYAPKTTDGLLKTLAAGGSYKTALAMTPGESTLRIAAQLDAKTIVTLTRNLMLAEKRERADRRRRYSRRADTQPASQPTTKPEPVQLDDKEKGILAALRELAAASDGNTSMFLTDLQMLMTNQPPLGFTLGLKDSKAAAKAIDKLIKLEEGESDEDAPVAEPYRNVTIRRWDDASIAILKDRAILTLNDSVMKAAIDTALDKTGGLAGDDQRKQQKMIKLAGDGSLVMVVDVKSIVRLGWPFLEAQAQEGDEDFPLVSLPSTAKMVRNIGPEVLVITPDEDGLMINGRGQIPLCSTLMPTYAGLMYMMIPSAF